MTRLLLLTSLFVTAFVAPAVNSAIAATAQQCETAATNCLGGCAGIDISTSAGNTKYGRCMTKCDGKRNTCMMTATGASKNLTVNPGTGKPAKLENNAVLPSSQAGAIKPQTTGSPPKAGTITAPFGVSDPTKRK